MNDHITFRDQDELFCSYALRICNEREIHQRLEAVRQAAFNPTEE
jgi:hypothetical protein